MNMMKYWPDYRGEFTERQLEDELTTAREIQQAFLPREYPDIPGLEFSHMYIPMFAVGGDFFDIKELSPGVVEVFISDVMGHGPQAAIITGIIKALLTQLSTRLAGPGYLLSRMNESFHNLMASCHLTIFATAFCMVIDTINNKYTYSNAGHPAPFHIQNSRMLMEELAGEPGPALGMIPNICYESHERELENDDMILFITDGLKELMNADGMQFGTRELQRAILNNMHLPPHSFIEAIMEAADAFSEGPADHDDITLLAVSCHSCSASEEAKICGAEQIKLANS